MEKVWKGHQGVRWWLTKVPAVHGRNTGATFKRLEGGRKDSRGFFGKSVDESVAGTANAYGGQQRWCLDTCLKRQREPEYDIARTGNATTAEARLCSKAQKIFREIAREMCGK
jgi:hypothetical protein